MTIHSTMRQIPVRSLNTGLVVLLAIILSTDLFGQQYSDIPQSKKVLVIDDNFDNGFTGRITPYNTLYKFQAMNGVISGSSDMRMTLKNLIEVGDNDDFEVEIYVKFEMSGRSLFQVRLQGDKTSQDPLDKSISVKHLNHGMRIDGLQKGKDRSLELSSIQIKPLLNPDGYNKYTLRRASRGNYYLFVNEKFAGQFYWPGVSTNEMLINLFSTDYELDYVKVFLLNGSKSGLVSSSNTGSGKKSSGVSSSKTDYLYYD